MITLTKDELNKSLTKALNHQPRFYSKVDGLSFRYSSEHYSSEAEYKNFQDILKALGSTKSPDLCQIEQGSRYPLWKVEKELYDKIKALLSSEGRSLLLLHYSGHSWLGENNELMLGPGTKTKPISWSRFISGMTDPFLLEGDEPIDIYGYPGFLL